MSSKTLAAKIDDTRLTTTDTGNGVRLRGSPFTLEFDDSVDPETFCETVCTAADPWRAFGATLQLEGPADDYWSVAAVLYHVEDGEVVGSSKVDLEVCPEWVRVYVKGEADADRVAAFVRTIDDKFGVDVRFADD